MDLRRVEIKINNVHTETLKYETKTIVESRPTPKPSGEKAKAHPQQNKQLTEGLILGAMNLAKEALFMTTAPYIQRVFSLKEDYMGENGINAVATCVNKATSAIAVGVGAATVFKTVGLGGVGAAVSLGLYTATQATELFERYRNYYQDINTSNINNAFARTRLGLSNGDRGTEN